MSRPTRCIWLRVEEVVGTELVAEAVTECDETTQRLAVDFSAGFDLETDNGAVDRLDDEVDLLAVVGWPVTEFCLVEQ